MELKELTPELQRIIFQRVEDAPVEWKSNYQEPAKLGRYISALSNTAANEGRECGYLVFGINNEGDPIGTKFDPNQRIDQKVDREKGNPTPLLRYLTDRLKPPIVPTIDEYQYRGKRLVILQIPAASDQPVLYDHRAWIRISSSLAPLDNYPEIMRRIYSRNADWTASIAEGATIGALDPSAILQAKERYYRKFPNQKSLLESLDGTGFLNRMNLMEDQKVTIAALILLGGPTVDRYFGSRMVRLTWIYRGGVDSSPVYEHFTPPFLNAAGRASMRIRNNPYQFMTQASLFPETTTQYDPWVIREALNNCIAHQEYVTHQGITVDEYPDRLVFTNPGHFLPGTVENVLFNPNSRSLSRNQRLATAMNQFTMIDQIGSGVLRMYQTQKTRGFPLPQYEFMNELVVLSIDGRILDESFARILLENKELSLQDACLLDRIQRKKTISKDESVGLRKQGLVAGRYPNLFLSAEIAGLMDRKAEHVLDAGLDRDYYKRIIIEYIRKHSQATKQEIRELLQKKLPDVLDDQKKENMIHNLLCALRAEGLTENSGNRRNSMWTLKKSP
jgi:ATP-dependent DNA helicase RecG